MKIKKEGAIGMYTGLKQTIPNITFVTMCFDLGVKDYTQVKRENRGTYEEYYLPSLALFLENYTNVVVFCDEKTAAHLKSKGFSNKKNLKLIILSLDELPLMDLLEDFIKIYENMKIKHRTIESSFLQRDSFFFCKYLLLVLSKTKFIQYAKNQNYFNSDYFCWIDAGCMNEKYSKLWTNWNGLFKLNTEKFKCCLNMNKNYTKKDIKNLDMESVTLDTLSHLEFCAAIFYIHKDCIDKFNVAADFTLSQLMTEYKIVCSEQILWVAMLKYGYWNLFSPIRSCDYNDIMNLVATSDKIEKFSLVKILLKKLVKKILLVFCKVIFNKEKRKFYKNKIKNKF